MSIPISIHQDSRYASASAVKEWFAPADTQTGKNPPCASHSRLFADYTPRLNRDGVWRWCNLRAEWVNGLRRQQRPSRSTHSSPSRAGLCLFFSSLSSCLHWVIGRPVCCNSSLALDGQIPEEMLECGLDTTHERWARGTVPCRHLLCRSLVQAAAHTGAS